MKLFFDFLPILLFFVAYKTSGIYVATAVAIAASLILVAYTWWRSRKVEPMQLVSLGLIVVFGGATLWLQNPLFIMWKPSILYILFAGAFLGSQFIGEKTLVERMMGGMMTAPQAIWRRVNVAWVSFFIVLAVLNLYVAYNFDEATWVNFKLFGLMGITLVFMLAQGLWLAKHATMIDNAAEPVAETPAPNKKP
ncbi:MAG: septation protein A [Gammaproteobacteria bacterium 28-57-27]|nr:MAG: septation protein A [Gammaproteobacteria bacterium 28-57-27]